jgi:hypothetical protein
LKYSPSSLMIDARTCLMMSLYVATHKNRVSEDGAPPRDAHGDASTYY